MNQPPTGPGEAWPPPVYQAQPPGIAYERDNDHLRLLSIFYYIWGGMVTFGSCIFIFYIYIGLAMNTTPQAYHAPGQPPTPAYFGNMFALMGAGGLVIGWLLGGLTLYTGYCLARRKHLLLITIVAALNCLSIPLGTVLGVFTFIVTSRPTVKALFAVT